MATTTGKTVALLLIVILILFIGLRLTPLFMAPFGMFAGTWHTIKSGVNSLYFWNYDLRRASMSLMSLALFIIWIAVIVWVYRDAERRGMNGILWALLVFIGNLIGLIIYLIVRNDNIPVRERSPVGGATQPCPSCQKTIGVDFAFCPHCGRSLQSNCTQCGKAVEPNWNLCPQCGEKLNKGENI